MEANLYHKNNPRQPVIQRAAEKWPGCAHLQRCAAPWRAAAVGCLAPDLDRLWPDCLAPDLDRQRLAA
jgi:hypothetical protein